MLELNATLFVRIKKIFKNNNFLQKEECHHNFQSYADNYALKNIVICVNNILLVQSIKYYTQIKK